MKRLVTLLALVLCVGCATPTPSPKVSSIVLSSGIGSGAWAWQREARKRVDRPLIVVCHGTTMHGRWVMTPDIGPPLPVEGVATLLKKIFPDRGIVLITCNADGHTLHVRGGGVWYAKDIVYNIPHTGKRDGVEGIERFEEAR